MGNAFCVGLSAGLLVTAAAAQTPTPIVLPAATTPVATLPAAAAENPDLAEAAKALAEMKAANDELLKRQQGTLDVLDQITTEADQLRIFSKRG